MKIALLDSFAEMKGLRASNTDQVVIIRNEKEGKEGDYLPSHGTLCATILDAYAGEYELISLVIMPEQGPKMTKSVGDVQDLRRALDMCIDMKADIVSLSCVSSFLSDTDVLYDVTQKLSENAVIIAALDNKRYFTVPTGYPFVLGAQADRRQGISSGDLFYRGNDPFCAELYARCNPTLLRLLGVGMSNSFAVPVAAARINKLMNETGLPAKQIRTRIGELIPAYITDSSLEGLLYYEERIERPYDILQIPLVAVSVENGNADEICKVLIQNFYQRYGIQVTCLTDSCKEPDIRFRSLNREKDPEKAIGFMRRHYKTDLILLAENTEQRAFSDVSGLDVRIECRNHVTLLWYDNTQEEISLSGLPERLYQILNGEEE